jgi:hypothetical protein
MHMLDHRSATHPYASDAIRDFVAECRVWCDANGSSLSDLSEAALNDKRFFARLARGRDAVTGTLEKVRAFMLARASG